VLATFNASLCHNRLAVALSSIGYGEIRKQSPGAQQKRAIRSRSPIGTGPDRHKEQWCDVRHPLFDSFIALRPEGLVLTLPLAAIARAKRVIKSSPYLWRLAQRWRRTLFGRSTESNP
jgi:hypothetical protein